MTLHLWFFLGFSLLVVTVAGTINLGDGPNTSKGGKKQQLKGSMRFFDPFSGDPLDKTAHCFLLMRQVSDEGEPRTSLPVRVAVSQQTHTRFLAGDCACETSDATTKYLPSNGFVQTTDPGQFSCYTSVTRDTCAIQIPVFLKEVQLPQSFALVVTPKYYWNRRFTEFKREHSSANDTNGEQRESKTIELPSDINRQFYDTEG